MTAKIAIYNPAPKSGSTLFCLNLAVALAQRGQKVLLVTGSEMSDLASSSYPRLSVSASGTENWQGGSDDQYDFVMLDIESDQPAIAKSVLSKSDEVILPVPATRYSLKALAAALKLISEVRAGNSNLKLHAIVETKRSEGPSTDDDSPENNTMETIRSLYPGLLKYPTVADSDEYYDSYQNRKSIIEVDPTNAPSAAFQQIAEALAPGDDAEGVKRRALKRHGKGQPPAKDGFFDILSDKFSSLFSSK